MDGAVVYAVVQEHREGRAEALERSEVVLVPGDGGDRAEQSRPRVAGGLPSVDNRLIL